MNDQEQLPQISNYQSTAILKELSDIKANLAINSTETANIKTSIMEIKLDMRDIKADFVTRREYNEAMKDVRGSISPLKKGAWGIGSAVGLIITGALLKLILK